MKIALITAHYMPEVGYQEVHLPKAFTRIGHAVKVFTSNASVNLGGEINKLSYQTGLSQDEKYGYQILRLPSISYKSKAYAFGLKKAVLQFNPDMLIILGVAKIFPLPLLNATFSRKFKIISIYGDAQEYLERNTFQQKFKAFFHQLGYHFIKQPLYRKALKHSHRLVMNIPETNHFFLGFLKGDDKKLFEQKRLMLTLGFNPDEYFFNESDRNTKRAELGITKDEIVLITSTRINKRKGLEKNIALISRLLSEGKKLKYIMVGFLGDTYERELKIFIQSQPNPQAFICFPFLNANLIQKLYCAADIGTWSKAAISIQEAMGTGLPVVLENKASVNHLINNNINGWFYEKDNFEAIITNVITQMQNNKTDRQNLALQNASILSYDTIAKQIIQSII